MFNDIYSNLKYVLYNNKYLTSPTLWGLFVSSITE